MSNSFFVNQGLKIYYSIENSYEKSFLHKIVVGIGSLAKESLFVKFIIKILFTESKRKTNTNSFFINFGDNVLLFLKNVLTKINTYFKDVSSKSFFITLNKIFLSSFKNLGIFLNSFGFFLMGFSIIRLGYGLLKGSSRTSMIIFSIFLLGSFILSFTKADSLENCIKNSILFKLANWFFIN